ncbi:hypothetical protein, partial [Actinomadura luteofluorescens]
GAAPSAADGGSPACGQESPIEFVDATCDSSRPTQSFIFIRPLLRPYHTSLKRGGSISIRKPERTFGEQRSLVAHPTKANFTFEIPRLGSPC